MAYFSEKNLSGGIDKHNRFVMRITLNSESDSNPKPLEYEAGTLTSDLKFNKTKGNNSTVDKSENYIVLGLKCKPGLLIFFGFFFTQRSCIDYKGFRT